MSAEDLTGRVFNKLKVVERVANKIKWKPRWLCKCECGTLKEVDSGPLKSGATKSCGCLKSEKARLRLTKHGLCNTQLYNSWRGMKERCTKLNNSHFEIYGGRGITFDPRWALFSNFLADMQDSYTEGLELDRVDVNGNYSKDNCRWSSQGEQCYNQRLRKDNKSGKTGVWLDERKCKWLAYIRVNNKRIVLGYFENFEEAVRVRELAEIQYYGYNRA